MKLRGRENEISIVAHRDGVGPQKVCRPGEKLDPTVGTHHLDRIRFERRHVEVPLRVKLKAVGWLRDRESLDSLAERLGGKGFVEQSGDGYAVERPTSEGLVIHVLEFRIDGDSIRVNLRCGIVGELPRTSADYRFDIRLGLG